MLWFVHSNSLELKEKPYFKLYSVLKDVFHITFTSVVIVKLPIVSTIYTPNSDITMLFKSNWTTLMATANSVGPFGGFGDEEEEEEGEELGH